MLQSVKPLAERRVRFAFTVGDRTLVDRFSDGHFMEF